MAKPLRFSHLSLIFHTLKRITSLPKPLFSLLSKPYSTTRTPYPLQYDMIISRPSHPRRAQNPRTQPEPAEPDSDEADPVGELSPELSFENWVDSKLTRKEEMGKEKRKYYNKRRRRMYGSDSDDERRRRESERDGFVELKPEVVELRTLHRREEELHF